MVMSLENKAKVQADFALMTMMMTIVMFCGWKVKNSNRDLICPLQHSGFGLLLAPDENEYDHQVKYATVADLPQS